MLNRSTSACTAAQKITKSSSFIRQATITTMLLLVAVFFVGCNNEEPKKQPISSEIINDLPDQYGVNNKYQVIVIDSCQYIYCWFGAASGGGSLTHKGNCKFCDARQHSH